MNVTEIWKAF